jgi:hypothetical protein
MPNQVAGAEALRDAAIGLRGVARREVVDIETVHGDVVLIGASAGDRTGVGGARLVGEESGWVAALLDGEVVQLADVEGIADGGVRGVERDLRAGGVHFDVLVGAGGERRVLGTDGGNRKIDILDVQRGKARRVDDQFPARSRRDLRKAVGTVRGGCLGEFQTSGLVGQHNLRAGDGGTGGIRHSASHA